MNVAVVGGAGFIGSRLTTALSKRGVHVVIADTIPTGNGENILSLRLDVMSQENVEETLLNYDIDVVVHLVGLPAVSDCEKNPSLSFMLNSRSTQNVIEAMRKTGVKKVIFASSASVYGYTRSTPVSEGDLARPDTIYGSHKLVSEELIRAYSEQYDIEYLILRLFNVYGNSGTGKDLLSILGRSMRERQPATISGPRKFRDFVHVDDVVAAMVACCQTQKGNYVLNIGSGVSMTLHEVGSIMRSIYPDVQLAEVPTNDDGTGLTADIKKARDILGFSPMDPRAAVRTYLESFIKT